MTLCHCQTDSGGVSWEVSHLEGLTIAEITALLDLIRAWYGGTAWTCSQGCRFSLLVDFAERHGFSGAIAALALKGLVDFKDERERLQGRYFSNLLYHKKCMAICRRLQGLAKQMAIPLTVIKGPALTVGGYQDPGVRSYSDIDVLTDSHENAMRLISAIGAICDAQEQVNVWERLNHPGRVHAYVDDWEVEFCYPVDRPGDPMFDLMHRHKNRLLKVPQSEEGVSVADASLHMVILIQHMARHLCNRFIWFLDLAVFERANRDTLDWQWIEKELATIEMAHIGHWISQFCRTHISPEFPLLARSASGWNTPFHAGMTSPEHVGGHISLFHNRGWRRPFRLALSPARFFLITDPEAHRTPADSRAAHWILARLMYALGCEASWLHRWLVRSCARPMLFFSRTTARILMATKRAAG